MSSLNKTFVLITGANGGIGSALAREFAKHGHSLLLHGRSVDAVQDIAHECRGYGVRVEVIAADLSLQSAPEQLHTETLRRKLPVSHLVNNAGFGDFGPFEKADLDKTHSLMMVNIVSLTELTHMFLPSIVKYSGGVLNVASIVAFLPGPLMAVYYASKAFVLSFSTSLHNELKGRATVTVLCPGPTKSGFQTLANMQKSKIMQGNIMKPYQVAGIAYKGFMAGKLVVTPGFKNKALTIIPRFMPRTVLARITRSAQSEK